MFKHLSLALLFLAFSAPAPAERVVLDRDSRDWRQVAVEAESGNLPVVVLISGEDCGYCELLKREILRPMRDDRDPGFVLRELDLRAGGKLIDFDGEKIRARIFLGRYEVYATPTLLFLDADGNPLREPITGYNGAEHFPPVLEEALLQSRVVLEQIAGKGARRLAGKAPRTASEAGRTP